MIEYNKEFVAKKIKMARINAGLTQDELAEKINISAQQVSRIEVGMYIPSLPTFLHIASTLNLTLNDFGINTVSSKNKTMAALIKLMHTFNETELECCYNTVNTLTKNFKLLKKNKRI